MVEKDNYATTSPLNEGSTVDNLQPNTNYIDSPFGNVKIYDLDAEIPPIERMQIVPDVPNVATTSAEVVSADMTSTIAPMSDSKKPNYLVYGGGALAVGLVAYMLLKKK